MAAKEIPGGGISRRRFVRDLAKWGAAGGISSLMLHVLGGENAELLAQEAGHGTELYPTPEKYYEGLEDKTVRCHICARDCLLPEGKTCFCRTHVNRGGRLYTTNFNRACILQKDPIEIGPFYHFRPGSKVMSIAAPGCMLRCLYCQGEFAQSLPSAVSCTEVDAWGVVKRTGGYPAEGPAIDTIMFTGDTIRGAYAEPVAYHEYMMSIAEEAMKHGIRRVCVSSGYWGLPALKEAIAVNDAFCIALKGFTEQFYANVLGAHLKPVLDNLVAIRQSGKWLEVVITLVPGYNDDIVLLKEQAKWVLSALGADTPVHYMRLEPEWKLTNLPRTPQKTLQDARRMALDLGLKYVYTACVPGDEGSHTYCPGCKKAVIERLGLVVKSHLRDKGACKSCGAKVAGVWM